MLKFAGSNRAAPDALAVAGSSADRNHPSNDFAHADQWGKEREVRAVLIRWLCVDARAKSLVDPHGLRLYGARITGALNLSNVTVPFAVALQHCLIPERMIFEYTEFRQLDLRGSHTGEIDGVGMVVHGDLDLANIEASGEVWFNGAFIEGDFIAGGSHLRHSMVEPQRRDAEKKFALDLGGAQIRGTLLLCCGFEADGAVVLLTTTVGTFALLSSATFNNPNNWAIWADGANFGRGVTMNAYSVNARRGTYVNGLVRMTGFTAGGLDVEDATFAGAAGTLHGFDVSGSQVKGFFTWQNVKLENGATLDLHGLSAASLVDEPKSWPAPGKLIMDGFTYDHLIGTASDARSRLRWLALQPEFHQQPYRQLAKVLRDSGDDAGADDVLVVAEDRRYAATGRSGALLGGLLNATIGYGHKPLRVVGWSLVVVLIGWPIVWMAKRAGVMRKTWPENPPPSNVGGYQILSPLLYSLDVFLPFVNLHQEHYWWPDAGASADCEVLNRKLRVSGALVQYYLWMQIMLGWLLSAILVAGVTGLMRSG